LRQSVFAAVAINPLAICGFTAVFNADMNFFFYISNLFMQPTPLMLGLNRGGGGGGGNGLLTEDGAALLTTEDGTTIALE